MTSTGSDSEDNASTIPHNGHVDGLRSHARDFAAGAVLFREGDRGGEMFVIQSGEVEISRRMTSGDKVLAILGAGEFFGEMAIINNRPRSATATVTRAGKLIVIKAHTFETMIEQRAEIAVRIIKALAARIERANRQIDLLLLRDANHRVVHCLREMAKEQAEAVPFGDPGGAAVFIPTTLTQLAEKMALSVADVSDVLLRLGSVGLVVHASEAGATGQGYVIPEVGRLDEFLEFLELKDRRTA